MKNLKKIVIIISILATQPIMPSVDLIQLQKEIGLIKEKQSKVANELNQVSNKLGLTNTQQYDQFDPHRNMPYDISSYTREHILNWTKKKPVSFNFIKDRLQKEIRNLVNKRNSLSHWHFAKRAILKHKIDQFTHALQQVQSDIQLAQQYKEYDNVYTKYNNKYRVLTAIAESITLMPSLTEKVQAIVHNNDPGRLLQDPLILAYSLLYSVATKKSSFNFKGTNSTVLSLGVKIQDKVNRRIGKLIMNLAYMGIESQYDTPENLYMIIKSLLTRKK